MTNFSMGDFVTDPKRLVYSPYPYEVRSGIGGAFHNFVDSIALETGFGQSLSHGDLWEKKYEPEEGYILALDPIMEGREHLFHVVRNSRSPAMTEGLLRRYDHNMALRRTLEDNDAGWSRFLGSIVDPLNFIPIPGIGGVGFIRGAVRGAGMIGSANAVSEMTRAAMDPTDTPQEIAMNLGVGFLFGASLGGPIGAYVRRANRRRDAGDRGGNVQAFADAYDASANRAVDADDLAEMNPRPRVTSSLDEVDGVPAAEHHKLGEVLIGHGNAKKWVPFQNAIDRLFAIRTEIKGYRLEIRNLRGTLNDEEVIEFSKIRARNSETSLRKKILDLTEEQVSIEGQLKRNDVKKFAESLVTRSTDDADGTPSDPRHLGGERERIKKDVFELKKDLETKRAEEFSAGERARHLGEQADLAGREGMAVKEALLRAQQKQAANQAKAAGDEVNALNDIVEQADSAVKNDDNLEHIGSSRIDGSFLRKFRWKQHPWFLLKNNKLPGWTGHVVRELADGIASIPGLRLAGAHSGYAASPSVEANALKHNFAVRDLTAKTWTVYRNYIDHFKTIRASEDTGASIEAVPIGSNATISKIETDKTIESWRQGAERVASGVVNLLPGRQVDYTSKRLSGALTWDEFKEAVTIYRNDPNGRHPFSEELIAPLKQAKELQDEFWNSYMSVLNELGLLQTKQNAERLVVRTTQIAQDIDRRLKDIEGQLDVVNSKDASVRKASYGRYKEGLKPDETPRSQEEWEVIQRDNLNFYLKEIKSFQKRAEYFRNEALEWDKSLEFGGDELDSNYFHRIFDPVAIEKNYDKLLSILTNHFMTNPKIRVGPKVLKLSADKVDAERRARQTIKHMLETANYKGGPEDVGIVAEMQRQLDLTNIEMARFRDDFEKPTGQINVIYDPTGTRKVMVGGEATYIKGARPGDDGYLPAFIEYDPETAIYTIRIDREHLSKAYALETGPAKQWRRSFDSAEEFVQFVERHEMAHTRLKEDFLEGKKEYERRINLAAWDEMTTGKVRTVDAEELRLRKQQQERDLHEARMREGHSSPSALLGRKLDIPNHLVSDFIVKDFEVVAQHYVNRLGPVIEMARKYGDHRLSGEMYSLEMRVLDEILQAGSATEREAIKTEFETVRETLMVLRDKVLKTYGVPEDPSRLDVRAARMLKNWAITAQMGRSVYAAFADSGRVVMDEGMHRMLDGMRHSFVHGKDPLSAFANAADEVIRAGVAAELVMSQRLMALMDNHFTIHRTAIEQTSENATRAMFTLNGLALWTDSLSKLSGLLIIDRVFKTIPKLLDGSATSKEVAQMADFGVDMTWARRYMDQWESSGAQIHDGLIIANTKNWSDQVAADRFRAQLATLVQQQVLTPGVADKINLMSDPIASFFLLYKGFMMGATNKIVLAGIQGKHAHLIQGVTSMVVMGMLVNHIKRPDYIEVDWDEWILEGIDQSGVTGLFMDINNMIEQSSGGAFGIRPSFGNQHFAHGDRGFYDMASAIGGPGVSMWSTALWAFTEGGNNDQARALRYLIPFNNVLWWGDLFDSIQEGPLTSGMEIIQ